MSFSSTAPFGFVSYNTAPFGSDAAEQTETKPSACAFCNQDHVISIMPAILLTKRISVNTPEQTFPINIMPTVRQQRMQAFERNQAALIKKMKLFYGGKISAERAIVSVGLAPYKASERRSASYGCLREWAEQQPWLRIEEANAHRNAKDVVSFRLVLIPENLPTQEAA